MEFLDQIIEMIVIGIGIVGLFLLAVFALIAVVGPILYIISRKERKQSELKKRERKNLSLLRNVIEKKTKNRKK